MTRLVIGVVLVAMLMSVGVAVAQGEADGQSWYDRISISGYFQVRYVDTDQSGQFDNFDFRRMYVTIRGDIDSRNTGIITFARVGPQDPNIDLYNAFVDYRIQDQYRVQIGQVPTWFGLEAWEGSSVRLPLERAKILEGTPAGLGFWWQGASDRGIWFRRMPTEGTRCEPMLVLGVWNGQFRADDGNDDKNLSVDLKWDRPWGQFGFSWFDGTFVDGQGVETDRNAWDGYVRLRPNTLAGPVGFQFEYADGELLGADRDGWYGQIVYDVGTGKDTLYARYQEYNATIDSTNFADFDSWTVGWAHRVYDSSQLSFEYTDGDWSRTGVVDGVAGDNSEDMFAAQWQYAFR